LRRNEVFLSTKIAARDAGEAMRQLETSMGRLQTDFLDNLMIHNVSSAEDVEKLSEKGGVIEMVSRLKEQGVTRFIGFSGHSDAGAKRVMIERGDFDTVLFAMNQYENYSQNREELVIPAALERDMGILLMKVVRPKETVAGLAASELIRFALSMEGPTGLVLGMDSVEVVRSNASLLKNFIPMTPEEMSATASALSPFFTGSNPEWTRPGYHDGYWS
jgi:predicted aldo/keto reductase-like oxidoreductase